MHFKLSKSAKSFFSNIINTGGSHAAEDKNKFSQFDVYYCCALIGMTVCKLDESTSDLDDMVEGYPKPYVKHKENIAGLLVATEAKRQGISFSSPKIEEIMIKYLGNGPTLLSEDGIKTLNAYSLKGYYLLVENFLPYKPTSREEFLESVNKAIQFYT